MYRTTFACLRAGVLALGVALVSVLPGQALAQNTLRIGAIGPFTGPGANTGLELRKGWEFVVDEVNKEGGLEVGGKRLKLEVLFEDSQSRPEVGLSAAQKLLVRDNVDMLVAETAGREPELHD